jgi:sugar phosphate permease
MIGIFKPVAAAPPLPPDEARANYKRLRVQVFGGAFVADSAIGAAVDRFGWDGGFRLLFGSCLISVVLFAPVWWMENREGSAARLEGGSIGSGR